MHLVFVKEVMPTYLCPSYVCNELIKAKMLNQLTLPFLDPIWHIFEQTKQKYDT